MTNNTNPMPTRTLINKEVTIYTDGACLGNPGPGGYGVLMYYGSQQKQISGGFRLTTNNRMEILAAIEALKVLKEPCAVTLYSDSRYLVDAMMKGWAERWQQNDWKRNQKERAKNVDLWEKLLDLCQQHQVNFVWVRGHNGNADNEYCDRLAVSAAGQPDLATDIGYEKGN
jgi:ribonuclease HI